jgi:hypothetical protein
MERLSPANPYFVTIADVAHAFQFVLRGLAPADLVGVLPNRNHKDCWVDIPTLCEFTQTTHGWMEHALPILGFVDVDDGRMPSEDVVPGWSSPIHMRHASNRLVMESATSFYGVLSGWLVDMHDIPRRNKPPLRPTCPSELGCLFDPRFDFDEKVFAGWGQVTSSSADRVNIAEFVRVMAHNALVFEKDLITNTYSHEMIEQARDEPPNNWMVGNPYLLHFNALLMPHTDILDKTWFDRRGRCVFTGIWTQVARHITAAILYALKIAACYPMQWQIHGVIWGTIPYFNLSPSILGRFLNDFPSNKLLDLLRIFGFVIVDPALVDPNTSYTRGILGGDDILTCFHQSLNISPCVLMDEHIDVIAIVTPSPQMRETRTTGRVVDQIDGISYARYALKPSFAIYPSFDISDLPRFSEEEYARLNRPLLELPVPTTPTTEIIDDAQTDTGVVDFVSPLRPDLVRSDDRISSSRHPHRRRHHSRAPMGSCQYKPPVLGGSPPR